MIVELKNICKTFGNHTVLKDFSLQIKGNEFVAIIGDMYTVIFFKTMF